MARALDIDGRTVDQQGSGVGILNDAARAEINLAHVLPRGQHGDDHVGARRRDLRGLGDRAARGFQLVGRGLAHIDAFDLMAGLDKIVRHRQAHVAEPDESDPCHGCPPIRCFGISRSILAREWSRCSGA